MDIKVYIWFKRKENIERFNLSGIFNEQEFFRFYVYILKNILFNLDFNKDYWNSHNNILKNVIEKMIKKSGYWNKNKWCY